MKNGVCNNLLLCVLITFFFSACNSEKDKTDIIHFPLKGVQFDSSAPQPKLWLSDTLIDLGEVPPDTSYVIPVIIKNIGDEELIIRRAFSDCGCVVSEIPEQPLQPGESDTLFIILNTEEIPLDATSRVVTIVANTVPNNFKIRVNFKMSDFVDVVKSQYEAF